MKIVLLHGDHIIKSYERFQKFIDVAKGRGWDIVRLNGSSSLPELAVSNSLFEKDRLFIVNGFNTISENEIEWISAAGVNTPGNLLIYNKGSLSKQNIKLIKNIYKVEEFKLPKKVWSFLDSFFPGNARNALILLNEVLSKEPPEFVFSLLSRILKDLYWVKVDPKSIDLPSWRLGKLKRQASKFSKDKLRYIINKMSKIDIKVKTSKANLTDELDLLIISQLE